MKKILILLLIFGIFATVTNLDAQKSKKPIEGKVVSINDLAIGSFQNWTKEAAEAEAAKGTPFVFMSGTGKKAQIYFVFNEDGTFASKKLAKYAHNSKVGIVGTVKKINGINILIMEIIESM